ncbi:MAG: hypothetical protein WDW38_010851 [Sanguina aurantia]
MVQRVLCVAEKPMIAKDASQVLSNGTCRRVPGMAPQNPNWAFNYTINGQDCEVVFTSVRGHLMELEFPTAYKGWHSCTPVDLFTIPVSKHIPEDKLQIKANLESEARRAQVLSLWLDGDREGENISFEVVDVCRAANPRLAIRRARFSSVIPREIHAAICHMAPPNEAQSLCVDTRQEIDLRVGAAFTRFQTLLLQVGEAVGTRGQRRNC